MIRFLILAATIWLTTANVFCQKNTDEIKAWQQQNPNVVFISYERLSLLSPYEREKLEEREVRFFHDKITLEDLYNEESKSLKEDFHSYYTTEDVKQWIANHPEVKIVKQSTFINSPISTQEEYQECSHCLILIGEFLSLSDINNYESEKQ